MTMTLSDELVWRGQIKDHTFQDLEWLNTPRTFYLGTDASSASLQIGNLAVYMLARRLAHAGWKTVLLVGGATSLVGDPGGKTAERELKNREEIEQNVRCLEAQVKQLLAGQPVTVVDNYDWFKGMGYLEFLRDVGKHYPMSELMQRDFVVERLGETGSGISYAEFSYSLIQGYDFWHLYRQHEVVLQIGGSDQWGNMLSGVPLIRKKEGKEVHALSMPLIINKLTGQKFGKSEAGTVWLDPEKTSVYQFYQFWLNVDDEAVEDYLKIYTEMDKASLQGVMDEFNASRGKRIAQKTLAYEVTKIVHGQQRADDQRKIAEVLFESRDFQGFNAAKFKELEKELPFATVHEGDSYIDALLNVGLATSKTDARRLIEDGAINTSKLLEITIPLSTIKSGDFLDGYSVIFKGKKHLGLLKIQ